LRRDLYDYCRMVPGGIEFLSLMAKELDFLSTGSYTGDKDLILGRLSEKEEAAGKVRVFAITDSITQSVFRPLSDRIFKILDTLPMDGTFDQDRPVRYLKDLFREDLLNNETLYSYDLSAATDRLPISLQHQILSLMIGKEAATSWVNILTNRD